MFHLSATNIEIKQVYLLWGYIECDRSKVNLGVGVHARNDEEQPCSKRVNDNVLRDVIAIK